MNRIAKELVRIAKQLLADSDYIYDPEHKKKPAGGYHKTEKGWSKLEQKKEEKSVKPVNKGLSNQHKQKIDRLSKQDKQNLAYSEEATTEILDYLSNDEESTVRTNVAKNPNTPSETLDKLSNDVERWVRSGVAKNPNTYSETLDKLSNDNKWGIRNSVAQNPSTSLKTLKKLSKDEEQIIRNSVAQNPKTSVKTLDKLSNDKEEYVRSGVAKNPNTSSETLDKLSKDESSDVRYYAKSNLTKRKQQQSKGNQNKGNQNNGIDFSKMTPELRQKIKDWDVEDIKKFINWLHKNGYKGVIPSEEEQGI